MIAKRRLCIHCAHSCVPHLSSCNCAPPPLPARHRAPQCHQRSALPSARALLSPIPLPSRPNRCLATITTTHPNHAADLDAEKPSSRTRRRPDLESCDDLSRPRAPAPRAETRAPLGQGSPPQMQSSASMGRQSQSRIEPWAIPSNVTYVRTPAPRLPSDSRLPWRRPDRANPRACGWETGHQAPAASLARRRHPCHELHLHQWGHCAFARPRRRARYAGEVDLGLTSSFAQVS